VRTLSPERSRQAHRLFEELADADGALRAQRLGALKLSDPELATAVSLLLEADAAAGEFLEEGPGRLAPDLLEELISPATPDASGERVGPWRLLSLLGRGGMGEVYLAERTDGEYEHRAALKLLKPGMDSEAIRRRFLRERQLLAGLQHPNIARLLDGGTAEGRPYFVLELVEGESILDYCRRHALPVEQRVRMMIDCCEAVDAAHRRTIVHRDIKPSNILVTAEGQVKLLDFGIAKLLSEEEDVTQLTHVEERVLTPAYAAPEQILGESVTTATDVFSLGVVFYQMLTGALPHRRGSSAAELASKLDQETVERPSRAVAREGAEQTGLDTREKARLSARLAGDLDSILLTALRREPERRYASAAALGDDLRRHLEGRPVAARPDTIGYRAGKFLRRHRAGVAAAVLVLLALVAGLAGTTWQARRAAGEARRAEENARRAAAEALRANRVKEFLIGLFEIADPEQTGGNMPAKDLIDQAGKRLQTELSSEPEIQADLLEAVSRIDRSLGVLGPAQALAEKSLEIRTARLPAGDPAIGSARAALGSALLYQGKLDEAEKELVASLAILDKHEASDPLAAARARSDRAQVLFWRDKVAESAEMERRVYETYRRELGADHLKTATHQRNLCVLYEALDRYAEAETACRESQAIFERVLGPDHANLAQSYSNMAFLLDETGRTDEAVPYYQKTIAVRRKTLGNAHPATGQALQLYALSRLYWGHIAEAEVLYKEAQALFAAIDPKHFEVGKCANGLAMIASHRGEFARAETLLAEAESLFRNSLGENHPFVWETHANRADQIAAQGRLDESERMYRTCVEKLDAISGPDSAKAADARSRLGLNLRRQGRIDEALSLHRTAYEAIKKATGEKSIYTATSASRLAETLAAKGDTASRREARGLFDLAAAVFRGPPVNPRLGEVLLASGRMALAEGDRERGRREIAESERLTASLFGQDHRRAREARQILATLR
jgi:serine/threonine-protein kinase